MFVIHLLQLALTLTAVYFLENVFLEIICAVIVAVLCTYFNLKSGALHNSDYIPSADDGKIAENQKSTASESKQPVLEDIAVYDSMADNDVVIHGYEPISEPDGEDADDKDVAELAKNVYTNKDEEFITNFIMLGKEKEAKQMLAECFERVGNDAGDEMVNYLVTNLVRTFVKLVANIKTDKKDSKYKFENMLRLVRLSTVDEMKEAVCEIAESLCSEVRQIRDDKEESISKRVQSYVEENFSDRELDVSKISDFLGLSPSYATRLFKQETGEVLSYYINRVRVGKARELLLLDMYRIEQVAHMVGYLDSRALSRSFKRFYGVTPSQYKEMSYIETNTGI